jgi:hypothetical protein
MLIQYVEQKKELPLSEQDKRSTEDVLQLKTNMRKQVSEFSTLFHQLAESKLFTEKQMEKIETSFFHQMQSDIILYNSKRDALFQKLKHNLPEELVETYKISQSKVVPIVDPIGFLGNSSEVKISNLRKYIEENQLTMFPYSFLKEEQNNQEVLNVVDTAGRLKNGQTPYIIGTLNNIDLSKILNGKSFDMSQCIFSKESETLMMSFMFQLPLLQTMNEEIKAIKQNNGIFKSKIVDLQNSLENFITNQYKINKDFNSKINQVVTNVNRLEDESYRYREKERMKNPTMLVEDTSVFLIGQITKIVEDGRDSFWGEPEEVVVGHYTYHPLISVQRPESKKYHVEHIYTGNLPKFNLNNEIKLEEAKNIVMNDLKSNFVCLLAKDIHNNTEKAKVLCTFGTGYHPLSQLAFTQQEQVQNKPIRSKKGIK